jgi:glycosyltransferase involved in cell wall biosynthesis
MTLKIAIVHYHLRPGGVTRVIEHALDALAGSDTKTVVLTGEAPQEPVAFSFQVIPELQYSEECSQRAAAEILREMEMTAAEALGGAPDVWHFHNYSLGKNLRLPEMVFLLAEKGARLLLQIHDFPEDGRPANYARLLEKLGEGDARKLGERLYPQADNVHYAVINGRDFGFFADAGMRDNNLHALPNAVCFQPPREEIPVHEKKTFVYPTRAIRRKNVGEFLFWAALADDDETYALTLAPQNPQAKPVYDAWVNFAQELRLPVAFDFGKNFSCSFSALLASAYACVTTSVAEGFGLAFLEPFLAGRPLLGRKLPEITGEFEQAGVNLNSLYDLLYVPLAWAGENELREKIRTGLAASMNSYGREMTEDDFAAACGAAIRNGMAEFGRLDEDLQRKAIRAAAENKNDLPESSPPFLQSGAIDVSENRKLITEKFGLRNYGRRLKQLYENVAASPAEKCAPLDAEKLLEQFISPSRFCLLRT